MVEIDSIGINSIDAVEGGSFFSDARHQDLFCRLRQLYGSKECCVYHQTLWFSPTSVLADLGLLLLLVYNRRQVSDLVSFRLGAQRASWPNQSR